MVTRVQYTMTETTDRLQHCKVASDTSYTAGLATIRMHASDLSLASYDIIRHDDQVEGSFSCLHASTVCSTLVSVLVVVPPVHAPLCVHQRQLTALSRSA